MKKTIRYYIKNALFSLSLAVCIGSMLSFQSALEKPNFSGIWVLNLAKSDFGDNALYVAPKKIEITMDNESLTMKMLVTAKSRADSTMKVNLSLTGKQIDMITADQRTRHYNTSWTANDQTLKEEYSSSYSSKPDDEEYHTVDSWKLSADGKELILDKQVKVANGYQYAVKAVYDKQ